MSLDMYQTSVPVLVRHLEILQTILKLGEANATERKIDPAVFINARLAPDMLPLTKQIQIASDVSKGGVARLAGVEIPSYADTEATFAELDERLAKTIAFIKSIPEAKLADSAEKTITLKVGGNDLSFKGSEYLQTFVVPNLYFHVTIAYAILRAQGVPLGKSVYLGATKK